MAVARSVLLWAALAAALVWPIVIAATSPLLAWRDPIYIAAGFAGVLALALLLAQPLLAAGWLPGARARRGRRLHAWVGGAVIVAILAHVGGLWLTSPPDVIDALLFRSPTPFAVWGVLAMWAAFAAAIVAAARRRLRPAVWRVCHLTLVAVVVAGGVAHAWLIEGTMGVVSKAVLCALVVAAAAAVIAMRRRGARLRRRKV